MVANRRRSKRSKAIKIMFLPLLSFMFIIGWSMAWLGHKKENKSQHKISENAPKTDNVTIMPIVFEDQEQLELAS